MKHSRGGFTLLELSVVLAVIGLLIGGIFTASTLIRASQIQAVIGEYDTYLKAINEFQDKFLALPGDMNNAESLWGTDPSGCPATPATSLPIIPTCNGDGNGTIGTSDTSGNTSQEWEWYRAWQQMRDAGFIAGNYTGTTGVTGSAESKPGINVPMSALPGTGWTLLFYMQSATTANLWGDKYGHILAFGNYSTSSYTSGPALPAGEAFALDQKIDDGHPGMGYIRTWRSALQPGCTTSDTTQLDQIYIKTDSAAPACSLIFILDF